MINRISSSIPSFYNNDDSKSYLQALNNAIVKINENIDKVNALIDGANSIDLVSISESVNTKINSMSSKIAEVTTALANYQGAITAYSDTTTATVNEKLALCDSKLQTLDEAILSLTTEVENAIEVQDNRVDVALSNYTGKIGDVNQAITNVNLLIANLASVDVADTGWINAYLSTQDELNTPYKNTLQYRKVGKIVYIKGCIKNHAVTQLGYQDGFIFGYIPAEYAPSELANLTDKLYFRYNFYSADETLQTNIKPQYQFLNVEYTFINSAYYLKVCDTPYYLSDYESGENIISAEFYASWVID